MERKLESRFNSLDLGISMYDKGQVAEYQKLIQQGVGVRLMTEVQQDQQQIEQLEKQQAEQRQQQLLDSNQVALSFVLWATLLTLVGIGGGSLYLVRSISNPLHALTTVAERISQGDLSLQPPQVGQRSDEIAILAQAFTRMSDYLHSMAEVAKSLANNQLHADVTPLSERDELGHAFVAMTSNLRTLVTEVQDAARQISGLGTDCRSDLPTGRQLHGNRRRRLRDLHHPRRDQGHRPTGESEVGIRLRLRAQYRSNDPTWPEERRRYLAGHAQDPATDGLHRRKHRPAE